MKNVNERPVCHRAEDLVTYLYGEATAEEARDFSAHMRECDACRAEFSMFSQVHDSIVVWRNEAIGRAPVQPQVSLVNSAFVQHEQRLSAWAAVREFFSVSPMWLRGATAFAGLLLCALVLFAVSRAWKAEPAQLATDGNQAKYSEEQFQAVRKQAAELLAKSNEQKSDEPVTPKDEDQPRIEFASRRSRPKTQPANKLTQEERIQLAADLGLIPAREDEQPFVLPDGDEPNQY